MAQRLGSGWTAMDVSALEQLEDVDYELLERVASALDTSMDYLITFSEVAVVHYLNTYFNAHELEFPAGRAMDPLDRVIALFERKLAVEREKVIAAGREKEKLRLEIERIRRGVPRI